MCNFLRLRYNYYTATCNMEYNCHDINVLDTNYLTNKLNPSFHFVCFKVDEILTLLQYLCQTKHLFEKTNNVTNTKEFEHACC